MSMLREQQLWFTSPLGCGQTGAAQLAMALAYGNWLGIGNLESRLLLLLHCLVHLKLFSHGIFHAALYKCVQIEIKRQFQSQTGSGKTKRVCVCVCAAVIVSQRQPALWPQLHSVCNASFSRTDVDRNSRSHTQSHARVTTVASITTSRVGRQAGTFVVVSQANKKC